MNILARLAQLENWIWSFRGLSSFDPTPHLQQTAWKVDYVLGDNANDGTPAHPVKSAAEIRRRWNGGVPGVRPTLPPIAISIEIVANSPAPFADPLCVLWDLDVSDGTALDVEVTGSVKRAGTILAVPNAFSRTATGQQTVTDAGVSDWSSDVDHPLLDTTSGALTWVTAGGGSATLASAHAIVTTPDSFNGLTPAAVAAADAYEILTLGSVYLGTSSTTRMAPGNIATNNPPSASVTVRRAGGLAQFPGDTLEVNGGAQFAGAAQVGIIVFLVECRLDQSISSTNAVYLLNCAQPSAFPAVSIQVDSQAASAYLGGYSRHVVLFGGGAIIDQDFFLLAGTFESNASDGLIALGAVGAFTGSGPAVFLQGPATVNQEGLFSGAAVFYGNVDGGSIFALAPGSRWLAPHGTAAASLVFDGGAGATFLIGQEASAVSYDPAAGTTGPLVTCTVGHLDAARPGGFGGNAQVPGVGVVIVDNSL